MHILFVAKQYFGNPDLVRLSARLARKKHRISVVTSFRTSDEQIRLSGVDIYEAPPLIRLHSLGYPLSFPISQLYRIVRGKGVEIVHALSDFSTHTVSAALVSAIANVPFVYAIQGVGWETNYLIVDALMKLYESSIERLIAKKADRVILLSERLLSRARKIGVKENKTVIIPSGVDCNYFDSESQEMREKSASLRGKMGLGEKIVVGYVGRLVSGKGLQDLISAIKQIKSARSNLVLLFVGEGPERTSLEETAKEAGIEAVFAGWQNEVLPYYSVMDIFVLPSLFEGLPNVLLEAMAMGKPVVATDVGANADLVENGVNGFLVSTRNPEQMASVLKKLVEDSNLRSRFGEIGREKVVGSFSLDKSVERVESLYNEIV